MSILYNSLSNVVLTPPFYLHVLPDFSIPIPLSFTRPSAAETFVSGKTVRLSGKVTLPSSIFTTKVWSKSCERLISNHVDSK